MNARTLTRNRNWTVIERRLLAAKPQLIRGGCVVRQKLPGCQFVWRVRYRDRTTGPCVHRAIYLGSLEFAVRARQLINQWRDTETPAHVKRRRELEHWLGLFAKKQGWSGRAQARLRREIRKRAGDPLRELALLDEVGDPNCEIRIGKCPRPRRRASGLW